MCSIYGAFGNHINLEIVHDIRERAKDRGRDGGNYEAYILGDCMGILGNWRATPTPEIEKGVLQPYDGLVHNGTIANDEELGRKEGEIDSQVLARVLSRKSAWDLRFSLQNIKGSFAIACRNDNTIYLARNYKPIYYYKNCGAVYFSSLERHFKGVLPFGVAPAEVPAYSVIDLRSHEIVPLHRQPYSKRAIVVCSAGLDSTTVAAKLISDGFDICLVHFDYGCKATGKEKELIPKISERLGCPYSILNLDYDGSMGTSPLLQKEDNISGAIAGAEYAHEWVPARNFYMMGRAVAFAEANGYHYVALGQNLEEAGAYPDNEEEMGILLERVMPYAVSDGYEMHIITPVGHLMKHEIVKLGMDVGAPFDLTWSCYRSGAHHCGQCGPCFMRKEAFARNQLTDPVMYFSK